MTLKNTATSAVLGLLFISLLAIFVVSPPNGLITFLGVLIMLVGLIIAQSRSWRDISVLAGIAALVSLVAAALVGHARFGQLGTIITVVVWGLILLVFFTWVQRNLVTVPKDRAILIRNQYNDSVSLAEGPISAPLTPFVDELLATIPMYELTEEISVKDINTNAKHNIDEVRSHIRYRVFDPEKAFLGMPKRGQAEQDILKETKEELEHARHEPIFWEKLLGRQMQFDAEDVIRAAIFDTLGADDKPYGAVDVYDSRRDLTTQIKHQLNERVERWGVKVNMVELEYVKVDRERFGAVNPERGFTREARVKEAEAEREAKRIRLTGEAQAYSEAMRVRELVSAIQDSGVDLSAEDLHTIVIDAIRAASEMGFERSVSEPSAAAKPAGR